MYKTHLELRTKSECGGDRTSASGYTKSNHTINNLDYAPKIMGTLNQNFPSFAKNLGRNQILKIETNITGKRLRMRNHTQSRTADVSRLSTEVIKIINKQ